MTVGEQDELYVLRRYFGIGAHEAWNVIPEWEIAALFAGWARANK